MFKPNESLTKNVFTLMRENRVPLAMRARIRLCMFLPRTRKNLELALTNMAISYGAIGYGSHEIDEDGIYQGTWDNLLDFLEEHWDEILEIILAILPLFF